MPGLVAILEHASGKVEPGTIVAGEHDQRLIIKLSFLEGLENPSDGPVQRLNDIAVEAGPGLIPKIALGFIFFFTASSTIEAALDKSS